MDRGTWQATVHGVTRVIHDWATNTSTFFTILSWTNVWNSKEKGEVSVQFSAVQSISRVQLFMTPWTATCQASLSITNSQSLLKLMPIESVRPSSQLILCHPLLLQPSIIPSIRVFSNESALRIRLAKILEFQFQHQSFQWTPRTDLLYSGLVGSPCPRDSQKSSLTPQFKSFLYSSTLTSIHDYWKNHSLD